MGCSFSAIPFAPFINARSRWNNVVMRAWHVRAAGGNGESALPSWYVERMKTSDGDKFIGFWEAMVRQELRDDPSLLES